MRKFYGVGVGPGDPELITVKGLNALKKAEVIFAPKAKEKSDSLAREIVEKMLEEGKEFVELEFPMTKNAVELRKRYRNAAERICKEINMEKEVAYLTIGDPNLYSTYIYLLDALKEVAPDLMVETIPGIPAYSAVSARLNYSLAEKNERICICPVPEDLSDLREIILQNDTVVIMKVAKKLREVIALLGDMNLLEDTVFGSRIGMEGEMVIDGKIEPFAVSDMEGYLSTIIVRSRRR